MRALNKSVLVLLLASLAGCGQQLVEFSSSSVPTVTSTDPLNSATGVGASNTVNATFSLPMDPATISATTFTVKQGTTPISGTVTYAGMTATFTPATNLSSNTFTATVAMGAKSASSATSLAGDYSWTFTTGTATVGAPRVTLTDPANGATGVATDKKVSATFSKAMDPTTIGLTTFTLKQGTTAIGGAVSYAGMTALFVPTNPLAPNTTYTGTITTGAKDSTGIAMAADFIWSFTTLVPPAINLRGAASFGLASQAGLTSTGVTVINGDVALYPTATCTDSTGNNGASQTCLVKTYSSPTGMTVNGSIYFAGDPFDNGGTANSVTNDLNIAWTEGKKRQIPGVPSSPMKWAGRPSCLASITTQPWV